MPCPIDPPLMLPPAVEPVPDVEPPAVEPVPDVEPAPVALPVLPAPDDDVPAPPLEPEPLLLSIVPRISTRLFTYCWRFSLPGFSRNVVPLADPPIEPLPPAPAAPEVALPAPLVPDVELPVAPADEPPPIRALVSMNCPPPPPLGR